MGEKNRHFSREFKRDAVQLVTEKGMPVGKVARELDIHPNLLHLWRRRFLAKGDRAFVGKGRVRPEEAEIRGLRKQLEKVRQSPSEGLIHHSDRGRQYASYAYQELLREYGMIPSMSRSGNCYDNAYVESFFGTVKTELVHGERYRTRLEARLTIFEYVQVFYNRQRSHSALGYKSPEQYEKLLHET